MFWSANSDRQSWYIAWVPGLGADRANSAPGVGTKAAVEALRQRLEAAVARNDDAEAAELLA